MIPKHWLLQAQYYFHSVRQQPVTAEMMNRLLANRVDVGDMKLTEEDSLDYRATFYANLMESEGVEDDAKALHTHLTFLREVWSGGDRYADLADDLQAVADNAADAAVIVRKYLGRGEDKVDDVHRWVEGTIKDQD